MQWLIVVVAAAGCTEANPAATCSEGTCSDPAFPYCDSDGLISGNAGSCIAVRCTPGAITTCAGDDALTCTADGVGYERQTCELGCFSGPTPHCGYIEPRYAPDACDSFDTVEDFVVSSSASIDPQLDSNCTGGIVDQPGAPSICVMKYRSITIPADRTLTIFDTIAPTPGRVVALVADTDLVINGVLDISANGRVSGPGGGYIQSGGGPASQAVVGQDATGAGGAGGRTAGAPGGSKTLDGGALNGGSQAADPAFLAALVGGASAVQIGQGSTTEPIGGGGGGGGATLVSCRGAVRIGGLIDAGGGGGHPSFLASGGFGGGAGGYVVVQARDVAVSGQLFANGGGGGAGQEDVGVTGQPGQDGSLSATDGAHGGPRNSGGGAGGKGGFAETPPTAGETRVVSPGTPGGGGGSVGFFQIYTPSGRPPSVDGAVCSPPLQPTAEAHVR